MIRLATVADAAALSRIGAETFAGTFEHLYSPEDLAAYLKDAHSPSAWTRYLTDSAMRVWVAEESAELIGYALAGPCSLPHPSVTPSSGELKRLYVKQRHHGTGVGKALFDKALRWLDSQGRAPLFIGVFSENRRAIALYERRGFKKVGEYEFVVGRTRDREFILRRDAVD